MNDRIIITPEITFFYHEDVLLINFNKNLKAIKLEPKVSKLLAELLRSKQNLLAKQELINAVWPENVFVGQNALRKSIYKLRIILKKNSIHNVLELITIPKKGYKLNVHNSSLKKNLTNRKRVFIYFLVSVIIILFILRIITEEEIDIQIPSSEVTLTSSIVEN